MRELDGRAIVTRVKGRGALTRSLAGLLIRANRFATKRAQTREDQLWAGRFIDALTAALHVARSGPSPAMSSTLVRKGATLSDRGVDPASRYPTSAERHRSAFRPPERAAVDQSALPLGACPDGEDG